MQLDELSGAEFLALATRQEMHCSAATMKGIPQLGVRGIGCLEKFGVAINVLSGAAGCRWGCPGGDHLVEYLLGRGASSAHAGYRLMMHGFYDECLGLARGLGELANLLLLFGAEPSAFAAWRASDRKERLRTFSPMKVRLRLESLKLSVGVQEDRYSAVPSLGSPPVGGNLVRLGDRQVHVNTRRAARSICRPVLGTAGT